MSENRYCFVCGSDAACEHREEPLLSKQRRQQIAEDLSERLSTGSVEGSKPYLVQRLIDRPLLKRNKKTGKAL